MRYRDYRSPCSATILALTDAGRQRVEITNISAEGARVAGLPPCPRGAVVRLDLMPGVEPARAEVRWMAGALAGLRFARPLSPAQVARLRGVTSPPGARRTARPIRTAQEMR